jgi:hypothetical protein
LGVTPHVARRDRPTNESASGVRDQFKQTLVGGETVRMAEANWSPEEGETARTGEGGLVVRLSCAAFNLIRIPKLRAQSA